MAAVLLRAQLTLETLDMLRGFGTDLKQVKLGNGNESLIPLAAVKGDIEMITFLVDEGWAWTLT